MTLCIFILGLIQDNKATFSLGAHLDVANLRKKLVFLREENSSLFIQNNKLMTELEKTSFKLKQCQDEVSYVCQFFLNYHSTVYINFFIIIKKVLTIQCLLILTIFTKNLSDLNIRRTNLTFYSTFFFQFYIKFILVK